MNSTHIVGSSSRLRRNGGFTLIELLVVMAILALLAALILPVLSFGFNTSNGDGTKVGQVVKLSKQGFISKTWEGQIIRGGMNGGSGAFGNSFDFTVSDSEMARQLQDAMDKQSEVSISYHIAGMYSPWSSESRGHFLTSFKVLTNSPPGKPLPDS